MGDTLKDRLRSLAPGDLVERVQMPNAYRDEWPPGDRGDPHGRARFAKLVDDVIRERFTELAGENLALKRSLVEGRGVVREVSAPWQAWERFVCARCGDRTAWLDLDEGSDGHGYRIDHRPSCALHGIEPGGDDV